MSIQFSPPLILLVMFKTVFLTLTGVNRPVGLSATIDLVRTPEFKLFSLCDLDLVHATDVCSPPISIVLWLSLYRIGSFNNIGVLDRV